MKVKTRLGLTGVCDYYLGCTNTTYTDTGGTLKHWYGYHSEKTMGYPYAKVGRSAMYVTRPPSKLCIGDHIWVVEGDQHTPTRFTLVDCFVYSDAAHPPFDPSYSRFGIRILGTHSILRSPIPLNRADRWFAELHSRFITKQKFFHQITSEREIVNGLCSTISIKP